MAYDTIKAYEQAITIDPLVIISMAGMKFCYRNIGRLDLAIKTKAKLQSLGSIF